MATQSIIAWNIPWSEEPGGRSPWGAKSWTQLSDWVHAHISVNYKKIRVSGMLCVCVCVYSYIYINIHTTFNYLKLALRTTI